MALSPGDKLGPYEILSPLGAGGMGQVWKARDTRLDRIVAIKTSAAQFSERFEREARSVAALNHPNVCQLYDVGPDYLVMEFVEGAPLSPPDSLRKLLDIAVQIADGLAAAHAAGIVHRDLKPDNILITRDGRVKILDFGLAKAAQQQIGPEDATIATPGNLTDPGTTIGTIAYMSPEQARGQVNLTAQSDQFSLGLVLYELASGKRAFQRGSTAEIMTAIIREDAEPLPPSVPAPFRWIVERLLHKEPLERYDSTRDLYRELRQVRDRLSESTTASMPASAVPASETTAAPKRRRPLWTGLAAGLAIGAGLTAVLIPPSAADLSAYSFTAIAQSEGTERSPAWSPDGKSVAYTSTVHGIDQVFTKVPGAPDSAQLTREPFPCRTPFWSPDGMNIFYTSRGDLWSVGASGGKPELAMKQAAAAALHPDGKTLVFGRGGKTWVAPLRGSAPREFASAPHSGDQRVTSMKFSPDGSRLSLVLDDTALWVQDWPSGAPRNLGSFREVSWLPDSRRVVATSSKARGELTILDTTDGSGRVIYRKTKALLNPSVSPDGRKIAYTDGATDWDVLTVSIPEGRVQTIVGGSEPAMFPDWAPSGTHFLYGRIGSGTPHSIEDWSTEAGFSRRVAESPSEGESFGLLIQEPRWSPDGSRFLFVQGLASSRASLMLTNASGGPWTKLLDGLSQTAAHAWSPDGEWVAALRRENGKSQLVKIRPVAGATPLVLGNAAPVQRGHTGIQWSPTGEWIAYPSADGVSLISPDGNTVRKLTARELAVFGFSRNGAQVYGIFRNTSGDGAQWQLYSVEVKTGVEKMLSAVDLPPSTDAIGSFSLHPDGRSFLTSVAYWPFDIWMLEGWDQPQKTWLDRLLRR